MRARPIFLIGGTGDVGITLARRLAGSGDWSVVLCSRNPDKVPGLAHEIGAQTLAIDAANASNAKLISGPGILVNLTEATTPEFIAACLRRQVSVIDSSATETYMLSLEAVAASETRGALVPQSGIMPGLSNLISFALVEANPRIKMLKVAIEMGMGRHHGLQATIWTLKSLGDRYSVYTGGEMRRLKPGALRRTVRFPGDDKPRPALSFPFSDQMVIARDPHLTETVSYLSLAPAVFTRIIGGLLSLGLGPLVARRAGFLARVFSSFPALGPPGTRMVVEGFDEKGEPVARAGFASADQAQLTALVLAHTVHALAAQDRQGIVAILDLMTANDVLAAIQAEFPQTILEQAHTVNPAHQPA